MPSQTVGVMVINNLVPTATRQAGTLEFGPVSIPAGIGWINIMFDLREVGNLTTVFESFVEVSMDDGQTWTSLGGSGLDLSRSGYRLVGGALYRALDDPLGPGPIRCYGKMRTIPNTELTTRQIRGTLSQSESVKSGVTVVVY